MNFTRFRVYRVMPVCNVSRPARNGFSIWSILRGRAPLPGPMRLRTLNDLKIADLKAKLRLPYREQL